MAMNDGGPAFPRPQGHWAEDAAGNDAQDGMSLRDYFAGQALNGLCHDYRANTAMESGVLAHLASHAYALADAMLAERAKVKP